MQSGRARRRRARRVARWVSFSEGSDGRRGERPPGASGRRWCDDVAAAPWSAARRRSAGGPPLDPLDEIGRAARPRGRGGSEDAVGVETKGDPMWGAERDAGSRRVRLEEEHGRRRAPCVVGAGRGARPAAAAASASGASRRQWRSWRSNARRIAAATLSAEHLACDERVLGERDARDAAGDDARHRAEARRVGQAWCSSSSSSSSSAPPPRLVGGRRPRAPSKAAVGGEERRAQPLPLEEAPCTCKLLGRVDVGQPVDVDPRSAGASAAGGRRSRSTSRRLARCAIQGARISRRRGSIAVGGRLESVLRSPALPGGMVEGRGGGGGRSEGACPRLPPGVGAGAGGRRRLVVDLGGLRGRRSSRGSMRPAPASSTRLYRSTKSRPSRRVAHRYVAAPDELIRAPRRGTVHVVGRRRAARGRARVGWRQKELLEVEGTQRARRAWLLDVGEETRDSSSSSASLGELRRRRRRAPSPPCGASPELHLAPEVGEGAVGGSIVASQLASAEWYTIVYVPSLLRWPTRPPYHSPPRAPVGLDRLVDVEAVRQRAAGRAEPLTGGRASRCGGRERSREGPRCRRVRDRGVRDVG